MKTKELKILLREYMAEARISQARLVDLTGLSKSTISDILLGKMGRKTRLLKKSPRR